MADTAAAADTPQDLDTQIEAKRNEVHTDKFDVTYGEFESMYTAGELVVSPAYQRLFRWLPNQKTRFLESILLGIPTPAVFVAEDEEKVWELVDGLQRLSTVLEFFGALRTVEGVPMPASRLRGYEGAALPGLAGTRFEDLSLRSRLTIRRAGCRVEVLRVGSVPRMKYDLFERLNTGGTHLEPQEIRNCIFRDAAPGFMEYIDGLADDEGFQRNLLLSDRKAKSQYDRGLVLRYLALRNDPGNFRHDVEPFITAYAHRVADGLIVLDQEEEANLFRRTITAITHVLGDGAWKTRRDGESKGAFSVYVYEALTVAVAQHIDTVEAMQDDERARCLNDAKEADEFHNASGAGGNTRRRFGERLLAARRAIAGEGADVSNG